MTTPHDPLEAELAALQPHDISPGLRQRIGERLAGSPPVKTRSWWGLALAGGMAAALAAALFLGRGKDRDIQPEHPLVPSQPLLADAFDDALPTVWVYHRALNRSPNEVEDLLDRHAGRARETDPERVSFHVFTRSDAELYPVGGEL